VRLKDPEFAQNAFYSRKKLTKAERIKRNNIVELPHCNHSASIPQTEPMLSLLCLLLISRIITTAANICSLSAPITLDPSGDVTLQQGVNEKAGTVTVQMTYNGIGWLAFGTSPSGSMPGSQVVIAKPADALGDTNPGKYSIASYRESGISLMSRQTLVNATFEQTSNQTILRYTKLLSESGEQPIQANAPNTFVWAVGASNTFSIHKYQGSFYLSHLTPCETQLLVNGDPSSNSSTTSPAFVASSSVVTNSDTRWRLWVAHGWMMGISWVVLGKDEPDGRLRYIIPVLHDYWTNL